MQFKKSSLVLILIVAFYSSAGLCQQGPERVIRVLGIVPAQEQALQPLAGEQLASIAQAWNNTGLPALTGVTVEILNGGVAQVAGQNITVFPDETGLAALQMDNEVRRLRAANAADIVIMFTTQVSVPVPGGVQTGLAVIPSSYVPDPAEWNLDLRRQNSAYVALANPFFEAFTTTAHEFGHMFGAGHASEGPRLFSDCRAKITTIRNLAVILFDSLPIVLTIDRGFLVTALASKADSEVGTGSKAFLPLPLYSSTLGGPQSGDASHNNARCLMTFALSIANYYDNLAPPPPPRLLPPINLRQTFRCEAGGTRYLQTWDDDPRTTAAVTRYDIYVALPFDGPYQLEGSEIQRTSNGLLQGNIAGRFKVSACSATACSVLSTEFLDLTQQCAAN